MGGTNNDTTRRVAVFIDFQNVAFSMQNLYGVLLDPQILVDKAKKYGTVVMIKAFADFEQPAIKRYIPSLKASGIDLEHSPIDDRSDGTRKDYTDFTMLEHIYQSYIDDPHIDVYILMTGDSHFSGVAAKFRNRLNKLLVVCGVPGAVSSLLERSATQVDHFEVQQGQKGQMMDQYRGQLVRFIDWGERNLKVTTFKGIQNAFAERLGLDLLTVKGLLEALLTDGWLVQDVITGDKGGEVRRTRLNRQHPAVSAMFKDD